MDLLDISNLKPLLDSVAAKKVTFLEAADDVARSKARAKVDMEDPSADARCKALEDARAALKCDIDALGEALGGLGRELEELVTSHQPLDEAGLVIVAKEAPAKPARKGSKH